MEYVLNSNWYMNFFVQNILGSERKINIRNNEIFSYYEEEFLMPRFFYLGITYKL